MSQIVRDYYDNHAEGEWERLNDPYSMIEYMSTLHLFHKYLPSTGHICDIGSGPGKYSIELLKRGYQVSLFEISQQELDLASNKINELGLKAEAYICEDAIHLDVLNAATYDAALVMGPLYHLHDEQDRANVIRNTASIVKKQGIAIFTFINTWGALKAGVTEFSDTYKDIRNVYEYLETQKLDENRGFTECYFSTPISALEEIKNNGFDIISYAGVEGFLAGMRREVCRLYRDDRRVYDNLVKVASETCELPQYRDATEHLLIVARKK
ncbi:SAM-dependent methyltransferase [Paenibacillus sp. DS2015]|uniref:class I SAM-dependent methyltransferase n=1 Tax=Paenibacillus sp. DS2015 TaxID=3373917 RepID=UPI003D1AA5CD